VLWAGHVGAQPLGGRLAGAQGMVKEMGGMGRMGMMRMGCCE
jgi:hypothetical protein